METIEWRPLVSVITPVYNGEKFIEELILSVRDQDYPSIEHIVIDDGSTDATVEILKKYPHLRWWTRENRGQYPTLNEGLSSAKGEFITIISADDLYASSLAVSQVMQFWRTRPDCNVVYGGMIQVDEEGREFQLRDSLLLPIPKWSIRYYCFIPHCSLFVRRKTVMDNDIFFDKDLKNAGDWDWMIRLSKLNVKFGFVKQYLSKYRSHPGQTIVALKNSGNKFQESILVSKRYGTNPFFFFLILRLKIIVSRIKKSAWILKTKGLYELGKGIKYWLNK